MPRLIISTTMRYVTPRQPSGYLYIYDLNDDSVLSRIKAIESPYRPVDPNPRGGLRGSKGIDCSGEHILISNPHSIFVFDPDWHLQRIVTHPSCAGIHEIMLDEDKHLWVTSTRNDVLFKFNLDGALLDFVSLRHNKDLMQALEMNRAPLLSAADIADGKLDFRDPRTHSQMKYDALHLNSIASYPEGGFLISLGLVVNQRYSIMMRIKEYLLNKNIWPWIVKINRFFRSTINGKSKKHSGMMFKPAVGKSAVVRLSEDGSAEPCLTIGGQHVPSHSIAVLNDETAFYLNSSEGSIIRFNIREQRITSSQHITDQFLRGVFILNDRDILVGAQNALVRFDYRNNRVLRRNPLSQDQNEAIFEIKLLPDNFSLPPQDLPERLEEYERINGKHIHVGCLK